MAAQDELNTALLYAFPVAAKHATRVEEALLGHAGVYGHQAALVTETSAAASGVAGDAFRVGLAGDCAAFIAALDGRYMARANPPPAGLPAGVFRGLIGDACTQVVATVALLERGRGHVDDHFMFELTREEMDSTSEIMASATYLNATAALVAALDARYESGTTGAPVGNAGAGLANAITRCVHQAIVAWVGVVEGSNGHGGHMGSHTGACITSALGVINPAGVAAGIVATLDGYYHGAGEE
jgi:hypothetical protein